MKLAGKGYGSTTATGRGLPDPLGMVNVIPMPFGGRQSQVLESVVSAMQEFDASLISLVGILNCPRGIAGRFVPVGRGVASIHDVWVTVTEGELDWFNIYSPIYHFV